MTAFFQTGMGHKFFNRDIPRLIEVLGRIADGLAPRDEVKAPQVKVTADAVVIRGVGNAQADKIRKATDETLRLAEMQSEDALDQRLGQNVSKPERQRRMGPAIDNWAQSDPEDREATIALLYGRGSGPANSMVMHRAATLLKMMAHSPRIFVDEID